jgi:hypothetical protein
LDTLIQTSTAMVLADLGRKINSALADLNKAPVIDEQVQLALLLIIVIYHFTNTLKGLGWHAQGHLWCLTCIRRQCQACSTSSYKYKNCCQCTRCWSRYQQETPRAKGNMSIANIVRTTI